MWCFYSTRPLTKELGLTSEESSVGGAWVTALISLALWLPAVFEARYRSTATIESLGHISIGGEGAVGRNCVCVTVPWVAKEALEPAGGGLTNLPSTRVLVRY